MIKMNKKAQLVERIKAQLKSVMELKLAQHKAGDLIIITEEDEIGIDTEVFVENEEGNNVPLEDGDYTLDSGIMICVSNGKITCIKKAETEETEETEVEVEAGKKIEAKKEDEEKMKEDEEKMKEDEEKMKEDEEKMKEEEEKMKEEDKEKMAEIDEMKKKMAELEEKIDELSKKFEDSKEEMKKKYSELSEQPSDKKIEKRPVENSAGKSVNFDIQGMRERLRNKR